MAVGYSERITVVAAMLAKAGDVSFSANPFEKLEARVCLAASARTGSNFFAERMRHHGVRIGEHLQALRLLPRLGSSGPSLEACCREIIHKKKRGGAFGFKGSFDALAILALAGEYPANIGRWRFVFLTREDIVKQAISHLVAVRSGAWRSVRTGSPVSPEDYDAEAIASIARRHLELHAQWLRLFADHGVTPHKITYEQLVADPETICADAARFIGLPAGRAAAPRAPPLVRQSGPLNALWEERFRAERGDLAAALADEALKLRGTPPTPHT